MAGELQRASDFRAYKPIGFACNPFIAATTRRAKTTSNYNWGNFRRRTGAVGPRLHGAVPILSAASQFFPGKYSLFTPATQLHLFTFVVTFTFLRQLVLRSRRFYTLDCLVSKPWPKVAPFLPSGSCLKVYRRNEFSIPTARRFASIFSNSRTRTFCSGRRRTKRSYLYTMQNIYTL